MSITTAMISVIMSPKVLMLVAILISMMCGTVFSDVQSVGISHSNNSSLSQSSSSQSGSVSATSLEKSSDASQSEVSVHSNAKPIKVVAKPGNASQPLCGTQPCKLSAEAPSSNNASAKASLPNEAEGIVHTSNADDSDDLSKKLNPEALMRGFYVFVGLSIIVMAYIAWKSFGKRPTQIHRYGVVGNRDDLEMAPLDSDDGDDDDTTHFDISNHRLQT